MSQFNDWLISEDIANPVWCDKLIYGTRNKEQLANIRIKFIYNLLPELIKN